jgi:hypothetical protein
MINRGNLFRTAMASPRFRGCATLTSTRLVLVADCSLSGYWDQWNGSVALHSGSRANPEVQAHKRQLVAERWRAKRKLFARVLLSVNQ